MAKLYPATILMALCACLSMTPASFGQETAAPAATPLDRQYKNYSEWTKGLFAEAVTVTGFGNGKLIYLGGIGAEEEKGKAGDIRSPKNFDGQCKYTFEKIVRVLGYNGATLNDINKMTIYLTSAHNIGAYIACSKKTFKAAGAKLPPGTLLVINRLAWPPMMLEIDVDAMTAK
jgi:enamine deaminase RidA (YjgF/YER057c/UK114 family)